MSAPTRRPVGRWRLRGQIDQALRDTYPDPDQSAENGARVVDCPYCRKMLRPAPRGRVKVHGDPLRHALHDHLFGDCPTVEATQ
jgi:hypothetical protein